MSHLALIRTYCVVLAERHNAIWYEDAGYKYADVFVEGEGWVSYSCNTEEEFALLCEQPAARVRLPRAVFWIKADPPNFYARKKKLKKFKKFS